MYFKCLNQEGKHPRCEHFKRVEDCVECLYKMIDFFKLPEEERKETVIAKIKYDTQKLADKYLNRET